MQAAVALTTLAATATAITGTTSCSVDPANAQGCSSSTQSVSPLRSLDPKVLVTVRGSGNNGESGPTPFYTIGALPAPLLNMADTTAVMLAANGGKSPLQRTDLDLGGKLAFYVDGLLTHDESDALASCANAIIEFSDAPRMAPGIQTPPGMRQNEAAHWYPTPAPVAENLYAALFERFRHLVPESMDGELLFPALSQKMAQFRYGDGDRFNPHTDGSFPGQGANVAANGVDEWVGVSSQMSILFYLNGAETDGLQGGETRLWSADQKTTVDVAPVKGRALFFRHGGGPGSVLHAGLPVRGTVPKHVARGNVAYGERHGTRPLF